VRLVQNYSPATAAESDKADFSTRDHPAQRPHRNAKLRGGRVQVEVFFSGVDIKHFFSPFLPSPNKKARLFLETNVVSRQEAGECRSRSESDPLFFCVSLRAITGRD
jgi:hypothetical protein